MPDIDFQKIELNLIPKKGDEPVIFYASQYETARPFIADLFWGDTEFEPGDDCWAEIDIRKNDDNLVVITDDVAIDNNEVSVVLPIQAVTCIGKNLGQVKIYAADDQLIAALNFILEVQPDPLAGGVASDTAIDNLSRQITVIADDVVRTIAPGIVMMEANEIVREKVGELGGSWFQFTMDKTHTEDLIDVPGFKNDSIIENVYVDTWDKITIKDITYVGGGGSYSRLKVYHNTYDDSDAVFYIHFFTLED